MEDMTVFKQGAVVKRLKNYASAQKSIDKNGFRRWQERERVSRAWEKSGHKNEVLDADSQNR